MDIVPNGFSSQSSCHNTVSISTRWDTILRAGVTIILVIGFYIGSQCTIQLAIETTVRRICVHWTVDWGLYFHNKSYRRFSPLRHIHIRSVSIDKNQHMLISKRKRALSPLTTNIYSHQHVDNKASTSICILILQACR